MAMDPADSTQISRQEPAPQGVACSTDTKFLVGGLDNTTGGNPGGGGQIPHQQDRKRARDGRGWGEGSRRPPPQLGATGRGPPGGGEGPRQTRGGGLTATRGTGGETPQILGGLGLVPQGERTGPRLTKGGRWAATGSIGTLPPPTTR